MTMSTYELDDDLVRAFCDQHVSPHDRLVEQLRPQLPARPIEEGCRVKYRTSDLGSSAGTCGKPFDGWVLVRWDNADGPTPSALQAKHLVRVD
jgi:hypothetical protein